MEKLKKVSPFRLSSLLRLQPNPNLALQLFLNPNPSPDPTSTSTSTSTSSTITNPFRYSLLSYDLIITKLGRAKMFNEMDQILNQMKQETRFNPKEIIFCNVISFYARSRLSQRAFRMFDEIPSFRCQRTVKSFNTLLNALLKCREFERIQELWMNVERYACPDVCTYNVLIHACCVNDSVGNALKLFDQMKAKGIRPNASTFATLISFYSANCMLDEALRLKEDMVRVYSIKPSIFVYTSLIKGFCKANELDLAVKLKEEMLLDEEVGVDSAVYSTLVSGLFRAGRKGEVSGVLDEMKGKGCNPDTVTYNAMITGFCNDKDFESALGVLKGMVENKCKPDVVSYNIIIAGFCKEGRFREAIDLFEDMPRCDCAQDVVTYRIVFDGLCDGRDFIEAGLILDEMVFKGYFPRVESVNKLVDGFCLEGNTKLLESVVRSLVKGNVLDTGIWNKIITTVCTQKELVNSFELVDGLIIV